MSPVLGVDRPLLLDGGTGRELLKRGVPILTEIWSATALYLAPEIVKELHADFIRAGADIITTNTYGIARERLAREGVEDRYGELNRAAGEIAGRARDEADRAVAIAGSLPPFSGSYRPDRVGSVEALLPLYREQSEILAPYVDLFICETMSSASDAFSPRLCGGCHWEAGLGGLDAARGPVRPPAQRRDRRPSVCRPGGATGPRVPR